MPRLSAVGISGIYAGEDVKATIFELKEVCKSYPIHHGKAQRQVLNKISLKVREGERWGILRSASLNLSGMISAGANTPENGSIR